MDLVALGLCQFSDGISDIACGSCDEDAHFVAVGLCVNFGWVLYIYILDCNMMYNMEKIRRCELECSND